VRFAALSICIAILLTACDRWDGLTVRNDGAEPLRIVWQFPGGRENPVYPYPADRDSRAGLPVAPGSMAEAGAVGGPPDPQPDIVVKAFSPSGTLVYCRRLTPTERSGMTSKNPLSVKPGEIRCT
jgi:hypothetical protein